MNIIMPQLGETVAEGKITSWFKKVGDPVNPGDNLFEIETDKVSMEVPATSAGVLSEIRVGVGDSAKVGAVVAVISAGAAGAAGDNSKAAMTGAPPQTPMSPARAPEPVVARSGNGQNGAGAGNGQEPIRSGYGGSAAMEAVPAPRSAGPLDPFFEVRTDMRRAAPTRAAGGSSVTPLARRLAAENRIDLGQVRGSGPRGRIRARDVEALAAGGAAPPSAAAGTSQWARPASGPSFEQVKALFPETPFREVPLDNMRRTIARRLVEAKQTIPHFYLTADIDLDRLAALRTELNAGAPQAGGGGAYKLSITDFVIKALAIALRRVPAANAVWAEDRILQFDRADVGVAVAIEGGLITPVIRGAETKSLGTISAEMKDLAARARSRKLQPHEFQGGSSAISNLGMYGVREFAAIINPPQSTILAVGAGQRRPLETADGGVRFGTQMTATLSCDHRVVDGALGAELLAAFRGLIQEPLQILI